MSTSEHDHWMARCLQLASLGAGQVAPNPMVGAVLVLEGKVLAEGWHRAYGGAHAEVECLRAFGDEAVPDGAVLYVNLEPCVHHGKTPPCTDLILNRGIRHVVVGQRDPFPKVAGRGIERLRAAGITITEPVMRDECRWAQRRFLTCLERGRPHVVLKWAASADGFLDQRPRTERAVQRISSPATDLLVHRWRSEEQAILAGSRTVVNDDPSLTVRHVSGRQPLRLVLDRAGITPVQSKVYRYGADTLLFTAVQRPDLDVEQVLLHADEDPMDRLLAELQQRSIRSVLVEGGAELLGHFLRRGIWDEARVITGEALFGDGTPVPLLNGHLVHSTRIGKDRIEFFTPRRITGAAWDW